MNTFLTVTAEKYLNLYILWWQVPVVVLLNSEAGVEPHCNWLYISYLDVLHLLWTNYPSSIPLGTISDSCSGIWGSREASQGWWCRGQRWTVCTTGLLCCGNSHFQHLLDWIGYNRFRPPVLVLEHIGSYFPTHGCAAILFPLLKEYG